MVLLGDATHSEDSFNVPGYDTPIPGVQLIASTAFTLAVAPIFELNSRARIALDLIIAIILIVTVELIRPGFVNKRPGGRFKRAQNWVIVIVAAIVFGFGLVMIGTVSRDVVRFSINHSWFSCSPQIEYSLHKTWKMLRGRKAPARKATS
jgi:C4-dicarboxylate transporter